MNTIPQWRFRSDSVPEKAQVLFEDGTILTWTHTCSENKLTVQGSGSLSVRVQAFATDHEHRFYSATNQFADVLNKVFPPRSLPEPVRGYNFITYTPQSDHIEYYFTDNNLVNYWLQSKKLVFHSKDSASNPLREAFEAAFPYGSSVLTTGELQNVLRGLCASLPVAEQIMEEQQIHTRPVRENAPYRDWFPYSDVRTAARAQEKCQEEVLDAWYQTLEKSEQSSLSHHLLVQAPTGLGKTPTALAPALTWQQFDSTHRQIYYLVGTVNQHDNPIDILKNIYPRRTSQGLPTSLRVVDLVGQHQLFGKGNETFCKVPRSRPTDPDCAQSRKAASWNLLPLEGPLSWREVAAIVSDQGYCPYHFLQGLMASADVIICDYWWVFSAEAANIWSRTSRFGSRRVALIVDEAHNLISRVRSAYDVNIPYDKLSSQLQTTPDEATRSALMPLLKIVFGNGPLAEKARRSGVAPSELLPLLDTTALEKARAYWAQSQRIEADENQSMSFEARIVYNLRPSENNDVVLYTLQEAYDRVRQEQKEAALVMRRVDATHDLINGYGRVQASITLSGTLIAPGDDENELKKLVPQFGLPESTTQVIKAATPFLPTNQLWVYDSYSLGLYNSRRTYFDYYCDTIEKIGRATLNGVTAVFFSSYEFMQAIYKRMPADERRLVIPESRADALADDSIVGNQVKSLEDYETQLRQRMNDYSRAYLFAIYSGKIAQGADFKRNLIKTVVCVSVPVEMVELFHQCLCRYLWPLLYPHQPIPVPVLDGNHTVGREVWNSAWEYAYERPGMYQVLQAVGRGIRSPSDRCAFVLLDRRYHEFKWHDFLQPPPFHTDTPDLHVKMFHDGAPQRFLDVRNTWEEKLFSVGLL